MSSVKMTHPNALFKCKYCNKLYRGLDTFVLHKRESHSDVVDSKRSPEKKLKSSESQLVPTYRPGPKSKKPQLTVVDNKSLPCSSRSLSENIPTAASITSDTSHGGSDSLLSSRTKRNLVKSATSPSIKDLNEIKERSEVASSAGALKSQPVVIKQEYEEDDDEDDDEVIIVSLSTAKSRKGDVEMVKPPSSLDQLKSSNYGDDDEVQVIAVIPSQPKDSGAVSSTTNDVLNQDGGFGNSEMSSFHNDKVWKPHDVSSCSMGAVIKTEPGPATDDTETASSLGISPTEFSNSRSSIVGRVMPIVRGTETPSSLDSQPSSKVHEVNSVGLMDETAGQGIIPNSLLMETQSPDSTSDSARHKVSSNPVPEDLDQPSNSSFSSTSETNWNAVQVASEGAEIPPARISILPVNKSKYRYKCWTCDEVFSKAQERSMHAKTVHALGVPFRCDLCSESFAQERTLIRHRATHSQHFCYDCVRKFETKEDLELHIETHEKKVRNSNCSNKPLAEVLPIPVTSEPVLSKTNASPGPSSKITSMTLADAMAYVRTAKPGTSNKFHCPLCPTLLKSKTNLRVHLRVHTGEKPFPCFYCNDQFAQHPHRKFHEIKVHGKTPQKCAYCPERFENKTKLRIHQVCHGGTKCFKCRLCSQLFKNLKLRKLHEQQHAVENTRTNQGKSTTAVSLLKPMLSEKRPKKAMVKLRPNPELKCKYCSRGFSRRDQLQYHENVHTGTKPYECKLCFKRFPGHSHLYQHQKSHAQKQLDPEASKASHNPKGSSVSDRDSYVCIADKSPHIAAPTSSNPSARQVLKEGTGSFQNQYNCNFCDKTFTDALSYKIHEDTHTGARPYCSICFMEFSNPIDCAQHEKTAHVKPSNSGSQASAYNQRAKFTEKVVTKSKTCRHCGKIFRGTAVCKYHENTHTGNRPYKCKACPFKSAHPSSLNRHMARIHNGLSDTQSKSPKALKLAPKKLPDSSQAYTLQLTPDQLPMKSQMVNNERSNQNQHDCSHCNVKFSSAAVLSLHVNLHHEIDSTDGQQMCRFCGTTLKNAENRKNHEFVHMGIRPFTCTLCSKSYTCPRKLWKHVRNLHKSKSSVANKQVQPQRNTSANIPTQPQRTPVLNIQAQPQRATTANMQTAPPPPKARIGAASGISSKKISGSLHVCKYCNKSFAQSYSRNYHENLHTGKRPFKCSACPLAFANPSQRSVHVSQFHKRTGQSAPNKSCTNESHPALVVPGPSDPHPKSANLVRNIPQSRLGGKVYRRPRNSNPVSGTSSNPSKNTQLRSRLQVSSSPRKRVRKRHIVRKYEKCQVCHKTYRKDNIVVHMRTHTGERPFGCTLCDKKFACKRNLQMHSIGVHDSEKRFQCRICYKKFSFANQLRSHQSTHDPDRQRSHECDICGKMYFTLPDLKLHSRIHARPFPCSDCGKSFDTKVQLDDHSRSAHTKDKPFECSLCRKRFASEIKFLAHTAQGSCQP